MIDRYTYKAIGGDLMAAEGQQVVFCEEVQFADIGLEAEVAGPHVSLVAIDIGGSDFTEGDIGENGKMLGQVIFKTDSTAR